MFGPKCFIYKFMILLEMDKKVLYNVTVKFKGERGFIMAELSINLKNSGITKKAIMEYKEQVENIHKDLHRRANDEKDFVRLVRVTN